MSSGRARLLIGLILGFALGLTYGWGIRPVEYVDTDPASLRVDYRTDYVLMVSEAYAAEEDLELAGVRLAALGPRQPEAFVAEAVEYAVENGFSRSDLDSLNRLLAALQSIPSSGEIGGP